MEAIKDRIMSVKEYAELKGVSVQSIYQAIKKDKLKGRKIGNFQFVVV